MKMKKAVSLLLSTVVTLSALAGCGGAAPKTTEGTTAAQAGTSATTEAKLEPIEYTYFIENAKLPDADNKFVKYIKDEFGISFKFDATASDIKTKVGVMIASGDYPDIIEGGDECPALLEAGAYMPLEELIEKEAPGLKKHYSDLWKKFHSTDGHVYLWPKDTYHGEFILNEQNNGAYWLQKAVMKEFGYPTVKTIDQFFDIVERYAQKYPQIDGQKTVPVAILTHEWRRFCLINGPVNLQGYPNNGEWTVDPKVPGADAYTVGIAQDKDFTKRYLQTYNNAYNKGLIDPESFTMTYDQYIAKISSGVVLGFYDHKWQFDPGQKALIEADKYDRTYMAQPVTFEENIVDRYTEQPVVPVSRGIGLSVKCKEPGRFLKFLEAMATDEAQLILNWGFEGEDYFVENGRFNMTKEQFDRRTAADAFKWNADSVTFLRWVGTRPDGNQYKHETQPEIYQANLRDLDKEILKAYGKRNMYDFLTTPPENPVFGQIWDVQLSQEANNNKTKLADLTFEYFVKAITAKPGNFETVWNEFQAKLQKIDYKPALEALQTELNRRMEAWK